MDLELWNKIKIENAEFFRVKIERFFPPRLCLALRRRGFLSRTFSRRYLFGVVIQFIYASALRIEKSKKE